MMDSIQKKPNVLLIDPPDFGACAKRNLQLPLGLIALYNYLKNSNVVNDIRVVDLSLDFIKQKKNISYSPISLLRYTGVLKQRWDVVAITTHYSNTLTSLAIARYFKKLNPHCLVVFGGVHASSCYQSLLENFPYIDLIILGEGEYSFAKLCQTWTVTREKKEFLNIPNAVFVSSDGKIVATEKYLMALDDLKQYDFSCVNVQDYIQESEVNSFWIESGRGCVFRCGFCISAKHWGHKCRYFSADKIVKDLSSLKTYGISKFSFTHDQFTFDKARLKEICVALINAKLDVEWGCYSRLSDFPYEDIELMSRAGCRRMFIGIESSMETVQKTVKKIVSENKLDKVLAACKSCHIEIESNIIFGFPEHDEERILSELLYCAKLKLNNHFSRVSISALELYPSTEFFNDEKYKDLFYFQSPAHQKLPELFSFKYEFRKKFWGMPVKVFIECARVWSTFFPETIISLLNDEAGKKEFDHWLQEHSQLLIHLHSEENLTRFNVFLELILNSWRHRLEISNIMIVECAVALLSVNWAQPFDWSGDGVSIRYDGNSSLVTTYASFNNEGFLEVDQSKKSTQFKITSFNNEIVIKNNLAA